MKGRERKSPKVAGRSGMIPGCHERWVGVARFGGGPYAAPAGPRGPDDGGPVGGASVGAVHSGIEESPGPYVSVMRSPSRSSPIVP